MIVEVNRVDQGDSNPNGLVRVGKRPSKDFEERLVGFREKIG